MILENEHFRIHLRKADGAIDSLYVKRNECELIGETRLASSFRICAPVEGYQCNYIESDVQATPLVALEGDTVTVCHHGLSSPMGEMDIDLTYTVTLAEEAIFFRARITNHSDCEVSEFWFPRFGGVTQFDAEHNAAFATPGYLGCPHDKNFIRQFPGRMELGSEAAEWSTSYPGAYAGMVMPWVDCHDPVTDTGLYFGYHDTTMRLSTWHAYLYPNTTGFPGRSLFSPEEACGEPVGLVLSHVRYPFLKKGETFDTGEFILRVHEGDWHTGSKYYRKWFMKHFPFDKKDSWLRKKSAWFTSIIYQPEDKVITDYKGYDAWCRDAERYGVDCHELIGWDKGGLERDYPEYEPEEKLGGREGFRELMKSIADRGAKSLVFVNYNVLDSCTQRYKDELHRYAHQDPYGNTPNWMCWGESTLLARTAFAVRRHHLASITPEMEQILEDYFLELVRDGAPGFQIDKLCMGSTLDFNPLNPLKPDEAACEGLVQAIARLLAKCREINPDFRLAGEAAQDRLIPYIDVYYRAAEAYLMCPLRYVFPEWTACVHVSQPLAFGMVNSAVMTGAVICAEPQTYQAGMNLPIWRRMSEYIAEVGRIREKLQDIIFTGEYCDELYAHLDQPAHQLFYRVHRRFDEEEMAIVVANTAQDEVSYAYHFDLPYAQEGILYSPFAEPVTVKQGETLTVKGYGLHIIVAKKKEKINN